MRLFTDELLTDIREELDTMKAKDVVISHSGSSNFDPMDVVILPPMKLDDVNFTIFSNNYKSLMIIDDLEFITVNHYLYYQLALISADPNKAKEILDCREFDTIIQLGNRLEETDQWFEVRDNLLHKALWYKFQNEALRKSLALTKGNYIIVRGLDERFDCRIKSITSNNEPIKIEGFNLTGTLLMIMRDFNVFFKELH